MTNAEAIATARPVAIEAARVSGSAKAGATMGALFAAWMRDNGDKIDASNTNEAMAAFRMYCLDAERKGVFA